MIVNKWILLLQFHCKRDFLEDGRLSIGVKGNVTGKSQWKYISPDKVEYLKLEGKGGAKEASKMKPTTPAIVAPPASSLYNLHIHYLLYSSSYGRFSFLAACKRNVLLR
jgi:hypothetical protein